LNDHRIPVALRLKRYFRTAHRWSRHLQMRIGRAVFWIVHGPNDLLPDCLPGNFGACHLRTIARWLFSVCWCGDKTTTSVVLL